MKKWLLLLSVALFIRLGAVWYWETRFLPSRDSEQSTEQCFFFGDSDSYWQLGKAIAAGSKYEFDPIRRWTVFRMPGYPALLAPVFWLYDGHPPTLVVRMVNIVLGSILVGLIGLLTYLIWRSSRLALLAGIIAAFEPALILHSVAILAETPFLVAAVGELILFVLLIQSFSSVDNDSATSPNHRLLWAVGIGLFAAIAVYTRPSWLYFTPFAFVCWWSGIVAARWFDNSRKVAVLFGVTLVTFTLCMAPWWYRNYRVTGQFVPTTLQMGASLYDGLNPQADGSSQMDFVDRFRLLLIQEGKISEQNRGEFEVHLDRQLKSEAIGWALANPGRVAQLASIKAERLWNPFPNESSFRAGKLGRLFFAGSFPFLILAVCGTFRLLYDLLYSKSVNPAWILLLPPIYITMLHLIFVSSVRYRMAAIPSVILLSVYVFGEFCKKSFRRYCKQDSNSV